ncbi:hypothetical protein H0H93_009537 [Arthromyces matolae]|nr:hypothetical protein H0H93_009537 [Arthromyces matolae]
MYQNLMQEAGLERSDACNIIHSPVNHKLAEKYYIARVQELRQLIAAEEDKFKAIVSDMDSIRSGNFDAEITAKITAGPLEIQEIPESVPISQPTSEEFFHGPDLTGVSVASSQTEDLSMSPNGVSADQSKEVIEASEGSAQEPIVLSDGSATPVPAQVTPRLQEHVDHSPSDQVHEHPNEEEGMVIDLVNNVKNKEEREIQADAVEEVSVSTPKATKIEGETVELPKDLEPEPSVGESEEEEEPLHDTRHSKKRRRSTLSSIQSVQTRGKARQQRLDGIPVEKDDSEVEMEEQEEQEVPIVETDRETSPVPSNTRRSQGKRKASFVDGVDSPRDKKRTRDDSEPVDEDEAGAVHTRGRRGVARSEGHKRFQAVIGMLHAQIAQHRTGNIFHNPIKNSEAPDYHEIVKRPMDLKTIKMRVKDGSIGNSLEYQRDIMLMFANAMMYNRPGSDVYSMAEDVKHLYYLC